MISPELITIGPLTIRWYGITATLGVIAGYIYGKKLAKWLELNADFDHIFFVAVIWGLVGARLYHVLNELPFYLSRPELIPAIWNGGLANHGGIIAGALVLWYYARKKHISFWKLADIFMPAAILGQAVGRWGNFFNQELFGKPTSLPWGITIDSGHLPAAYAGFTMFHPTFLYQSLWNILLVIGLTLWIKKSPPEKSGEIFSVSLIGWGLGRFLIELLRIDQTPVLYGIRLPLIISVLIIIAGIFLLKKKPLLN